MTPEQADTLKRQVDAMTLAQLHALWRWISLALFQRWRTTPLDEMLALGKQEKADVRIHR